MFLKYYYYLKKPINFIWNVKLKTIIIIVVVVVVVVILIVVVIIIIINFF
jgi:hypothetical protein